MTVGDLITELRKIEDPSREVWVRILVPGGYGADVIERVTADEDDDVTLVGEGA